MQEVDAKVRFVSFEPMLDYGAPDLRGIDWIVLGAATAPYRPPEMRWIQNLEEIANAKKVKIWEKNNLVKLLNRPLRQEVPG